MQESVFKNMQADRTKTIIFTACSLGLALVSIQSILMRELLATFSGNELIIAIVFALWFIASSIGSMAFILSSYAKESISKKYTATPFLFLSLFALLSIITARVLPYFLRMETGTYPPILMQAIGAILVIVPIAYTGGWLFPYLCSLLGTGANATALVLIWEAIGFMLGGSLFSFFMADRFNPYIQMMLSITPILASTLFLEQRCKLIMKNLYFAKYVLCFLFILIPALYLEKPTELMRLNLLGIINGKNFFSSDKDVHLVNSKYQKITVIKEGYEYSLYCNNHFTVSFPDRHSDIILSHFLLAQNPDAKQILIIDSNPFELTRILNTYGVEQAFYLEPDHKLVNTIKSLIYPDNHFDNLTIINMDPLAFFRKKDKKFDAIIIKSSNPSTMLINRLYTVEFYELLKQHLSSKGFIYTELEVPAELYEPSAVKLVATIFETLKQVFPKVFFTYGTHIQFFAGNTTSEVSIEPEILYKRISLLVKDRSHFPPEYFLHADEIAKDKIDLIKSKLQAIQNKEVNTIYKPIAMFYQIQLFGKYMASNISLDFTIVKRIILAGTLLFIILTMITIMFPFKIKPMSLIYVKNRILITVLLFFTGFFGMTIELVLIMLFQSFFGFIYSAIAFLSALFMFGFTLGSAIGYKIHRLKTILRILFLGVFFKMALLLYINKAHLLLSYNEFIIYLLVLICGIITGIFYILSLKIASEVNSKDDNFLKNIPAIANLLDLAGAAVASLCFASIFLPIIGIKGIYLVLLVLELFVILPIALYFALFCKYGSIEAEKCLQK